MPATKLLASVEPKLSLLEYFYKGESSATRNKINW